MTQDQQGAQLYELSNFVYRSAQIALGIVMRDQSELTRLVASDYEKFQRGLGELSEAARCAGELQEVIRFAEARLTVVLAEVQGSQDGGKSDSRF